MIWDSFLRFLVDLAWFFGLWVAAAVLVRLLGWLWRRLRTSRLAWRIRGRRARRRPVQRPDPPFPRAAPVPDPSEWSAALLVRPLGDSLEPSVQLRGSTLPGPARIRIDLIDPAGVWHRLDGREVSDADLGREVSLPAFRIPEGVEVADVLSWVWRVVLELENEERVLCEERLRPFTTVTPEAELGAGAGV